MYKAILSERNGNVLKITLNRPDVYNAFNEEMLFELQDAFRIAAEDENVRCVILTGSGKAFCSGQDLKDFNVKKSTFKEALETRYNPLIKQIAYLPKPVVCALNGVAAGAGLSIALACDYRIAVENASLTEVFINVGLVPDSGSSFFLPRIVGYAKAFEMCVTGEKISAREAKAIGLINKIVSNNKLLVTSAEMIAKDFAARPTKAIGMIKDLLNKSFESGLEEILGMESNYQEKAGNTLDFKEGIKSFLEKRKSNFTGK
ncbi:MAG: enoyl-CoA hydratase-related protein [bacterium]